MFVKLRACLCCFDIPRQAQIRLQVHKPTDLHARQCMLLQQQLALVRADELCQALAQAARHIESS